MYLISRSVTYNSELDTVKHYRKLFMPHVALHILFCLCNVLHLLCVKKMETCK